MENDPKPYKFMKESIKKQPPDWKKIVLLIAGWLALAALGGLVAAAVFAVTEPKIAEAVTREELPAKVDIPGDEDPNSGQEPDETITASSASASVDSSGSGSKSAVLQWIAVLQKAVYPKVRFPKAQRRMERQRERKAALPKSRRRAARFPVSMGKRMRRKRTAA